MKRAIVVGWRAIFGWADDGVAVAHTPTHTQYAFYGIQEKNMPYHHPSCEPLRQHPDEDEVQKKEEEKNTTRARKKKVNALSPLQICNKSRNLK